MVDMRTMLEAYANLPAGSIKGTRAPFLKMGGNEMFRAYNENGFEWDCSWSTTKYTPHNNNSGLWPYTLDCPTFQVGYILDLSTKAQYS